jgi:hypothetical protein
MSPPVSDRATPDWRRVGINYPFARSDGSTIHVFQAVAGITYKFGGRRETASYAASVPPSGAAVPILGAVVDSKMRIVRFFPRSVLSSTGSNWVMSKGTLVKIGYLSRGQWQTWIYIQSLLSGEKSRCSCN